MNITMTIFLICGFFPTALMAETDGVSLTPEKSIRVTVDGLELQGTIRAYEVAPDADGAKTFISMPVIEYSLNGNLQRVSFSMDFDNHQLDPAKIICGLLQMKEPKVGGRGFHEGDLKAYMAKSNGSYIVDIKKHYYSDSLDPNEVRIRSLVCSK